MPVTFPSDKTQPFVAENGVTYVWANTHWRVKQYQLNAEGYVEQGEFEESQGVQDDQINALETQIQLLAKVRAVGVWKYKNQMNGDSVRPPLERGTFYGTNINEVSIPLLTWEDLRLVLMNEYDVDGTKYNFQSFNVGDRFEILSTDGKDAVFGSIAAEPNPDNSFANVLVSVERSNGGPREDQEYVISVYPPGGGSEIDLDALDHRYLIKTGDTMKGVFKTENEIRFEKPDNNSAVSRIRLMATNVDADGKGGNRLQITSHPEPTGILSSAKIHIDIVNDLDDGPNTILRWLPEPSHSDQAVSKQYVDSMAGGVPIGSIMMWVNAIAPDGWFKLKGADFDIDKYPLLHEYLQQSQGYKSGKLPDWRGHYPAQLGDHLNGDVGIKLGQRTAKPSGGSPHSSSNYNNGGLETANKAGGTNFASTRVGQVAIDSGWDDVTRPKTVAVHFIIKHD